MGYKIFDASGKHIAGDDALDEVVKAGALIVDGWVVDDAGSIVYTSPRRKAALEQAAAEAAALDEE